jgi:hypothetical protein
VLYAAYSWENSRWRNIKIEKYILHFLSKGKHFTETTCITFNMSRLHTELLCLKKYKKKGENFKEAV